MAYQSQSERWAEERERVAARQAKQQRKAYRLAEVEKLPMLSQRIIGRILAWAS